MTFIKPTFAALALLAAASVPSHAALMSGQDLIAACSGDAQGKAVCDGYLMAVTDAVLQREARGHQGGRICVPTNITTDQVRQAVLGLSNRPRAMNAPAGVALVAAALKMTWPCDGAAQGPGGGRWHGQGQGQFGGPPTGAPPTQ